MTLKSLTCLGMRILIYCLFFYHISHGSLSSSKAMAVLTAAFEKYFTVLLWHTWHGLWPFYQLGIWVFLFPVCDSDTISISAALGSHILAPIALVVEFSTFSTNLLHEKRGVLVFAGLFWCRVDEKEQDWIFTSFTKQNWKIQIIASICVVLGIFGGYIHVFQYTRNLKKETIKEETMFDWNLIW